MNNSKFWGAGVNNSINSLGNSYKNIKGKDSLENKVPEAGQPLPKDNNQSQYYKVQNNIKRNMKKSNLSKKLGITGIILLVIIGVVALGIYLGLVKPAMVLASVAKNLVTDKDSVVTALKDRDLIALDKALEKTELDLNSVREARDKNIGWLKNVKILKANEFYEDSDRFINAGFYAIDAVKEMEVVILPFADAAGLKVREDQQVEQAEGLMEAFQTWVSIMPEVANQMDGVIEKVAKVGDELAPIDTSKYPEKIKNVEIRSNIEFIKNNLSKADDYAPDVKNALIIFPKVLAVGTPVKRYMIIMQNDKEIRPTGGFMTNYATFKIQNALLQSDFTSKDMYSVDLTLDAIDATYDFPDPPAPYMKYLKVERWYARDMNYSPDFPTSMDQFMVYYNMAGRIDPYEVKPVDGIFAIDTEVVRKLLEVTGPVTLNAVTYNQDNVVLELETIASLELSQQVGRKRVLGNLMQAMLVNVFESDKNLWPKLIETGIDLARKKHIQIYVFDPEAQILIEKYNLSGRITDPLVGDYSLVVSTNLGGDKTNWFVNKEVEHSLERSGDRWLRTVKITYSYPQPSAEFTPFIKGFRDWVRVYAPAGSDFVSVDGSEDGTSSDSERGKVWYSGYLELTPGQEKTMVFKYYLPDNVIKDGTWNLKIQKQAGTVGEKHKIMFANKDREFILDTDVEVKTTL